MGPLWIDIGSPILIHRGPVIAEQTRGDLRRTNIGAADFDYSLFSQRKKRSFLEIYTPIPDYVFLSAAAQALL
jgi:hypothetical protein